MIDKHAPYYGTYLRLGVHVHAPTRDVIRAALRKLKRSARAGGKQGRLMRSARHEFLRSCLYWHEQARKVFTRYAFA